MILLYKRGSREQALKKLGVKNLYPWQAKAVTAILGDEDVFAVAPTGGGKSLLFQLPAVMESGRALTIVISPLRALQADQVQSLKEKEIAAELLNSDLSAQERKKVLNELPGTSLLYLAPEQLGSRELRDALQRCFVKRLVVDEAHILPQVETEFRPAYGQIRQFICTLPLRPQIIACTATATQAERDRIIEALGMCKPQIFMQPVRRDNLLLLVQRLKSKDKAQKLKDNLFHAVERTLFQQGKNDSIIVYCPTIKRVEQLQKWLSGRGWKAGKYTGEMSQKERQKIQRAFLSGKTPILVATNAFGLGINKPDVRLIIHAGLPLTLSGYVQEIGRAGRDGKPAVCVLFYTTSDVERNKRILARAKNDAAVHRGIEGLNALKNLIESKKCLWCGIEKYYGEKSNELCGHCLRCMEGKRKISFEL